MTKSIEVQGRTEEEAIEIALEQLGMSRDDVSVEIVETAKTGLFGLKNTPATVKVQYDVEEDDISVSDNDFTDNAKIETEKHVRGKEKIKATVAPSDEQCRQVDDFLSGLFKRMDIDVSFEVAKKEDAISVTLTCSDPGVLIGRRGETLDSLQHITNYAINRGNTGRVRINLDAENYRQRRSGSLENLAKRTAEKVIKYRRNMTLDPMNAYERHIIHAALQDNGNVSTFSVGKENNRRVVIAYGQNKEAPDQTGVPQYKEWK